VIDGFSLILIWLLILGPILAIIKLLDIFGGDDWR